jgi:hypothetical protein
VLSLLLLAYLVLQFNLQTYAIGIGFAAVGELVYWADGRRKKQLTKG